MTFRTFLVFVGSFLVLQWYPTRVVLYFRTILLYIISNVSWYYLYLWFIYCYHPYMYLTFMWSSRTYLYLLVYNEVIILGCCSICLNLSAIQYSLVIKLFYVFVFRYFSVFVKLSLLFHQIQYLICYPNLPLPSIIISKFFIFYVSQCFKYFFPLFNHGCYVSC